MEAANITMDPLFVKNAVPPNFYPSIGSELFDERTPQNGLTLAASSPLTTLTTFNVPVSAWGILKGFGQGVAVIAAWSNIVWGLQINGAYISGYSTIYDQLSTLTRPIFLFRELRSSDIIRLVARNQSTTTSYTVYGHILGWYYSGENPIEDFYEQGQGRVG